MAEDLVLIFSFFAFLFFLFGTFILTALSSAFRRLHKRESKKQLKATGRYFFYRGFHLFFFPQHEYEGIYFANICALSITRFCYAAFSILFLINTPLFHEEVTAGTPPALYDFSLFWMIIVIIAFILGSFIFGDYLPRNFGSRVPKTAIRVCAPFSNIFMLMAFPLTFIFLKLSESLSRTVYFDHVHEPETEVKQEFIDYIQKAEINSEITPHDKKILKAVLSFKDRIAREIMVPRVDVFSLPDTTTIKEAAQILLNEGYSRTPIYHETVDDIIGVLMYKDILAKYMEFAMYDGKNAVLEDPVTSIMKPPMYTPETKKISNLLQEIRKKKIHMAIVVDEYGGTEGIVTIEDILEEIVGDISDEYDLEEKFYSLQPDGSWVIDGRMTITDIASELGVIIPQEGDFDTLGGYIFQCTGTIPKKGFVIHRDDFELEIVDSNERVIELVRLKAAKKYNPEDQNPSDEIV